jgi:hypothetical protein
MSGKVMVGDVLSWCVALEEGYEPVTLLLCIETLSDEAVGVLCLFVVAVCEELNGEAVSELITCDGPGLPVGEDE